MSLGVVFPFSLATGSLGYVASTDSVAQAITSNVKALLLTNWGERPMQPKLGCNLREFLFEPQTQSLRAPIADRIRSQLNRWMPFLTLTALDLVFPHDEIGVPENSFRVDMKLAVPPSTVITVSQLLKQ